MAEGDEEDLLARFSITTARADTRVSTADCSFSFLVLSAAFSSGEQVTSPASVILLAVSWRGQKITGWKEKMNLPLSFCWWASG